MWGKNGKFADRTQRVGLPNGLTLLVYENHANPTIQISAAWQSGTFLDPVDNPGLALITASMLKRGTTGKSKLDIAQTLEDVGAELNIHANRFFVRADGLALSKDSQVLLGICAEVLRQPVFPEEELEKLKHQVIGELKRQQDNTSIRAFEQFLRLAYDRKNPFYKPPVEERIASLESITSADVRRFYDRYVGAGSLTLVVVGDVDASVVQNQIDALFGDWHAGEKVSVAVERTRPQDGNRRQIVVMEDKANVDIVLGHAGQLRRADPEYYAAYIANAALGHSSLSSRLGLRVRDQAGLTYGIVSRFFEAGMADGPWAVSLTVNPDNVDRAVELTMDVLRDYVEKGITDSEVEDEKSAFVGAFIVSLGTNAGLASHLLTEEIYGFGPGRLDEIPNLVTSVTRDEVNECIRRYIHPESIITVIAGQYQPQRE